MANSESANSITELRRVEAALQESEERFRIFLEYLPATVAMLDRQMRYTAVSRRWLNDYGLTASPTEKLSAFSANLQENFDAQLEENQAEDFSSKAESELIGCSHCEVFPLFRSQNAEKHQRDRWQEIHRRGLAGELQRCEKDYFLKADGSPVWVKWEIQPWRNSAGEIGGLTITIEEICDASASANLLDRFFTLSLDLLCVASFDGYLKQINPTWVSMLGFSIEELLAQPFINFVHPDDRELTLCEIQNMAKGLSTISFENRFQCSDGSYRWVLWKATPLLEHQMIYAIGRDISDSKQAEFAQAEREQFLRSVYEGVECGIFVVDVLDREKSIDRIADELEFRFAGINPSHERLTGLRSHFLQGKTPEQILPPPMAQAIRQHYTECVRAGNSIVYEECVPLRGINTWWLTTLTPLRDINGCIYRLVGTSWEITDRKQAIADIKASEENYRSIFEAVNDGILIHDIETGNILDANQKACELSGYDRETIRQKDINSLSQGEPPYTQRDALQWIQKAAAGEPQIFEWISKHSSGRLYWTEVNLKRAFIAGEDRILVLFRDISERKKVEESLQRISHAVESSSDAIGIADASGTHIYQNSAFSQLFEYETAEEFHSAGGIPVVFADRTVARDLLETIIGGNSWIGEVTKRSKSGRNIQVLVRANAIKDTAGNIIGFIGISTDITLRKQAENNLRQQAQIINQVHDAVIATDLKGTVTIWNQSAERIYGYQSIEAIGKHISFLYPPDKIESLHEQIVKLLQEKGVAEIELKQQRKSGEDFYALVGLSLLKDYRGKAIGAVGSVMDISDRKRAEEALRRSEAQYRELAQREKLLNRLANQIRNTLNLDTILETAVQEIQMFLKIDSCTFIWYRIDSLESAWEIVKEAKQKGLPSQIGRYPVSKDDPMLQRLLKLEITRVDDLSTTTDPALQAVYKLRGYTALLALPIQTRSGDFGTVSCGHFSGVRHWSDGEVELLSAVCDQLAIAISQAELYNQANLSAEFALQQARQIESALYQLQHTQSQLIQSEKMSSLGQLVAGVAHEINNPVNFIYGNLSYAKDYTNDILKLLQLYREVYPNPTAAIQEEIEAIELDFVTEDLPKLLSSMQVGADRIREIVLSLRNFSRIDESEMKEVDIREGLDSTLMILANRLKAKPEHPAIVVIKEYGNLPKVECYPGQLNQVFMNILTNAIDALDEYNQGRSLAEIKANPSTITIRTELVNRPNKIDNWVASIPIPNPQSPIPNPHYVTIRIADNGSGMTEEIKKRLFDPFFTTKPLGKGTGIGLAISHSIIVEKHRGILQCNSAPGQGAEFVIEIPLRQSRK